LFCCVALCFLSSVEVTKQLAAQWKTISDDERAKYNELAAASKAAALAAAGDDDEVAAPKKKGGERKKRSGKAGPKKPPTARALWEEQKGKAALKAAEPALTTSELKSKLGEQWKSMTVRIQHHISHSA